MSLCGQLRPIKALGIRFNSSICPRFKRTGRLYSCASLTQFKKTRHISYNPFLPHRRYHPNITKDSQEVGPFKLSEHDSEKLEEYRTKKRKQFAISDLLKYGSALNEDELIQNANALLEEIPVRIAHRILDLQQLPYIVGCNKYITQVHNTYKETFSKVIHYPPIETLQDEKELVEKLKTSLKQHNSVIYYLSLAVPDIKEYMEPQEMTSFMDKMLYSRISRRILCDQHISYHRMFYNKDKTPNSHNIGIFNMRLNVYSLIKKEARVQRKNAKHTYSIDPPTINVQGHLDLNVCHITAHVQIMIREILKNSIEATISKHHKNAHKFPINVLIVAGKHDLIIRIRDQGGGIPLLDMERCYNYTYSRLPNDYAAPREEWFKAYRLNNSWNPDHSSTLAGPGFGLPMTRIYANYFEGSIQLHTMPGLGMDATITIGRKPSQTETSIYY